MQKRTFVAGGLTLVSLLAFTVRRTIGAGSGRSPRHVGADIVLGALDHGVDVQRGTGPSCGGHREVGVVSRHAGVVRIMGHPEFVGAEGRRAVFRKRKSLELLVWLSLNRDRMRRSAARNALWEVGVSDATFATVVSEMRRALREVLPDLPASEIARPTYTDVIDLTSRITTDFELLVAAHREFRDGGSPDSLAEALRGVRDAPFSGANFAWADGDGTTTRIVISVVDAAVELADWALAEGDLETASVAMTAGLRTMPEHPELLSVKSRIAKRRGIGV